MTDQKIQADRQIAYQHFAEGRLEQALNVLRTINLNNENDPQTSNDIAVVLFKLGRFEESLQMFKLTQALRGDEENLLVNNLFDALQDCCDRGDTPSAAQDTENVPKRSLKILMVCEHFVASGGLLRLEHVAEFLHVTGHQAAFLPFSPNSAHEFSPSIPALTLEQASQLDWDAVIIPGAGFSRGMIAKLDVLRASNFGTRIQLILNDQSKRDAFLSVNQRLRPHMVLFNNLHWPDGSFRDFSSCQFHYLLGGVDTVRFFPHRVPTKTTDNHFTIGAQAAKNPEIVLKALELLPENHVIHFFGFDRSGLVSQASEESDRVKHSGPLFGKHLTEFYNSIDAMVSVEESAGWANVVAEAMSSGVPVITTPAGVEGIARDYKTALVIPEPSPTLLAEKILELSQSIDLQQSLAKAARHSILDYDWRGYTKKLVELISDFDGDEHYTRLPGMGLFGKASLDERLDGLAPLLEKLENCSSSLDLGAAEGVLSAILCNHGIENADAYELDAGRVRLGRKCFGNTKGWNLEQINLSLQSELNKITLSAPLSGYDLVFYLGIHQHLNPAQALRALNTALSLCNSYFAIRTPLPVFERQGLQEFIEERGFSLDYSASPTVSGLGGELKVFRRDEQ